MSIASLHINTLTALESFPSQLEALFDTIPDAYRHWAPPSWEGFAHEPFTAIEHLCHVRDIEIEGYQTRIRRILTEPDPALPSINGKALAIEREYHKENARHVLISIQRARRDTLTLIGSLSFLQLRRSGNMEGYGPLTLHGLVHYLSSHDLQHLSALQWLAGKIASDPTKMG